MTQYNFFFFLGDSKEEQSNQIENAIKIITAILETQKDEDIKG